MTCADFHALMEKEKGPSIESVIRTPEFSAHIAQCSDCKRFVDEQREVARCLLLVRDSAPAIPASLDTAVLTAYRTQRANLPIPSAPLPLGGWNWPRATFRWAAAVTLAAIVSYVAILVFSPRQQAKKSTARTEAPFANVHIASPAIKRVEPVKPALHNKRKSARELAKVTKAAPAMAEAEQWFPARFQGLMYCDPLSCPGAMEVIRVELPSPVFDSGEAGPAPRGVVFADVLVGADGIARGIHVVE